MKNLVRLIGPAPSELPPPALLTLVRKERTRVREELQRFKDQGLAKRKGSGTKKEKVALITLKAKADH